MASSKPKTVQKPEVEFKTTPPDKHDHPFEKVLVQENCATNGNYTIFQIQCSKNESELNPDVSLDDQQNQSIQKSKNDQRHVFFELCPEKCNITFKITANCSINDSHRKLLRQEIYRHIMVAHPNPEYYPCFKCNFKFFNHIFNHERSYHASFIIRSCGICGKRFKTNGLVSKHIWDQHSILLGLQAGIGISKNPDILTDEASSIKSRLLQKFSKLQLAVKGKLLIREQYIGVFSEEIGMPLLTVELLTPKTLENNMEERYQNRKGNNKLYKLDIEAGISQLTNHAIKSVYCVQGHMAAAANHRNELNPYLETFLMSNIVPMNPTFNVGVWLSLENYVRKLAKLWDSTTVISGIIVDKNDTLETVGLDSIVIPSKCWKIIIYERFGGVKNVQSFLIPNNNESCGIFNYISSIEEIEEAAGLKFASDFKEKLVCPINKITHGEDKITLSEKTDQQEKSKSPVLKSYTGRKSKPTQLNQDVSSKPFSTERAVDRNVINPDKSTYICPHCKKAFSCQKTLKDHLLLHEPKKFKCGECNKDFAGENQLKRHLKNTHFVISDTVTLRRSINRRGSNPQPKINTRLTEQENPEPGKFVCQACEKVFSKLVNFNRHKKIHGPKSFKCDKCNKGYVELRALNTHKRRVHEPPKFYCKICSKGFAQPYLLRRHKSAAHSAPANKNKWALKCPKCKKEFLNKYRLRRHVKRHGPANFVCELCNKAYVENNLLTRHKQEAHPDENQDTSSYICIECNKEFNTKIKFQRHARYHKPKTFICAVCNKGFGELHRLKLHHSTHSVHNSIESE